MNKKKPMVFISCGQFSPAEKMLGKKVKELVEELTSYNAYFAETVTSLDSLTRNIFETLNMSAGLITIMHHRGDVSTKDPNRSVIRGSLWIEQEIAIAAFLQQILKRQIDPIFFVQEGIAIEGVRAYLHFNPILFKDNKEIIENLRERLPNWKLSDANSETGERPTSRVVLDDLISELKSNAAVARKRKPWTTYSISNRGKIPSLEEFIGADAIEKISDLYLNLESCNSLITRVKSGWWGDVYLKKYYSDLVEPIESAIGMINEMAQIKSK